MNASEKIFVTGATGVVGARAIPLLVAQGHEVTAIGRTPDKRAQLQSLGARGTHPKGHEPPVLASGPTSLTASLPASLPASLLASRTSSS